MFLIISNITIMSQNKSPVSLFLEKKFDISLYADKLIKDHQTIKKKNFHLLQLIVLNILWILLAFIFLHIQWNIMTTKLTSILTESALWADSVYKSICPSLCLSVCLSVCLFTFEVPCNDLFAPTSRSRISNIFRDSESLGKSNGKKWSNIWTFLFESCLKLPRKKKVIFCCWFCGLLPPYPADMRVITALSHSKSCLGYNRLIPIKYFNGSWWTVYNQ